MVGSERVIVPPIAQLRRMDLPSHAGIRGDRTIRIRSRSSLYGTEASAGVVRIFTNDAQDTEEEPEEQRRRRKRGRR